MGSLPPLMLVRETLLPHNTELDGIQVEEDFILMKPQTTMLKPPIVNSLPPLMSVRETLLPLNTELDGIQVEEDSIHMRLKTTMLKHLSLMLELEISDKVTNFMLGTQEIEDTTIMKVNLILLKLQHQTH